MQSKTAIASALTVAGLFLALFLAVPPARDSASLPDTLFFGATSAIRETSWEKTSRVVPEGWSDYRNAKYRFSVLYPNDLAVEMREEGGGAATITFQNPKAGRGFQVFMMPYTEPQVTEERFKKDVPSGVRTSLTNIIVDGAVGAAFYSRHDLLGETREIWLIHKGFLYEITTLKPLDTWLDSIMGTWKFI